MGFLQRIFGTSSAARNDAQGIYDLLMSQSRKPVFFGAGKVPDSYDGRLDFLSLHLSVYMRALQTHGENGQRLSQALYDVFVDDLDVALREEGLTDSGVKRRIKPMVGMFYERLKAYSEALEDEDGLAQALTTSSLAEADGTFIQAISVYARALFTGLEGKNLRELAERQVEFPDFTG